MAIRLKKSKKPLEFELFGVEREVFTIRLWIWRLIFYPSVIWWSFVIGLGVYRGQYRPMAIVSVGVLFFTFMLVKSLLWTSFPAGSWTHPADRAEPDSDVGQSDPKQKDAKKPASDEVKCANCQSIVDHRKIDCPECGANTRTGA